MLLSGRVPVVHLDSMWVFSIARLVGRFGSRSGRLQQSQLGKLRKDVIFFGNGTCFAGDQTMQM